MTDDLQQAIDWLNTKAPKANIKGRDYTQVATRVEAFRRFFGTHYGITTEMMPSEAGNLVRVRATITNADGGVLATGMAEEDRNVGNINKTSALENCETSAIGRALAAFGLHGGEFATANEVEGARHQEQATQQQPAKTHKASANRGQQTDKSRVRIETPERPDAIPVPAPGDGQTMDQVWRAWAGAYKTCVQMAPDVETVNEWERANEQTLANLAKHSTQAEQHLRDAAKKARGALSQSPTEKMEAAE